jgi:hypothetical protein
MEKKTKKKKKVFKIIFSIFIISAALIAVIYFSLPFIIESIIFPILTDKFGIKNASIIVEKADYTGLDISSIKLFGEEEAGIKVDSVKISTEETAISSLDVKGLNLNFDLIKGKLSIPGIIPSEKGHQKAEKETYAIPSFVSHDFTASIAESELSINLAKDGKINNVKFPFDIKLHRHKDYFEFKSNVKDIIYKDKKTELSIPDFSIKGRLKITGNGTLISGIAKFADISIKAGKLRIKKIDGSIPFDFFISKDGIVFNVDITDKREKGNLKITDIFFAKKSIGDAFFKVFQKDGSFILSGEHTGFIQGEKTLISGKITPPSGTKQLSSEFNIDFEGNDLDLKLSDFHPKAGSAQFKGDISSYSYIKYKNKRLSAESKISVNNGILEDKKRDLTINGISLKLDIEDVFELKSRPSQTLSFSSLKFKTFEIENGKISFQTESLKQYLIEKSEFKWSQGSVSSNAFKIFADNPEDIDLVLYCDRLNVSAVLNQFNIGKASGGGNVSGKIPLIYKKRRIWIDDGFLYSTPGIGGNISLTDFMGPIANTQGIAMEIAIEALKDFNYDWMRIKLNSEKEDLLLLKLEMSGKPAPEFLPFTVDLETGYPKKSTDPNQKAKFKGISFDINFRLPADQVLDYGTKLQKAKGHLK